MSQPEITKIQVIKPNSDTQIELGKISLFAAGSIEMGKAEDWQKVLTSKLEALGKDLTVYNPRRDDWDSSWTQEQSNLQFNHQVNWELNKLDQCDIIFMYFSPETQSPISLLELGRYAGNKDMVVCCPNGFWRKGNVEIICTRTGTMLFENFDSAVGALITKINQYENERN
jgi:hypothetical protein